MNESEWRKIVISMARKNGWLVSYIPNSMRVIGDRGVPDLVLSRSGSVILVELKTDKGELTVNQRRWIRASGDHARVWRPADRGKVERELKNGSLDR